MVVIQASKLNLRNPSLSLSSSSPQISSLLFEPNSLSLALMHSDSSFSLYPSISPLSISYLPSSPQTLIPAPCSSSTFLLLQQQQQNPTLVSDSCNGSSCQRVVFIVGGPHRGGSRVLLRFYVLGKDNKDFSKPEVVCNQKGIEFDKSFGVLLDVKHGVSIDVVGSTNYFAMYSASSSKVWVFGLKLVDGGGNGGGDGAVVLKLMRCAVIECCRPIWSMSMSFGVLVFGESNGVRVFNLRDLVKVKNRKVKYKGNLNGKLEGNKRMPLLNGMIRNCVSGDGLSFEVACNGSLDGKVEKQAVSVKRRFVKYRQESGEAGVCFLALKESDTVNSKITSTKVISIRALSPKKFLILDSAGDLHMLHVSNFSVGSNITCHIRQLPHLMEVQKLAVLPEISSRNQTVWISDGCHSVHMVGLCEEETSGNENEENESEEKLMKISAIEAIFTGEKVQDAVPISGNSILILGQGSLYTYAIS